MAESATLNDATSGPRPHLGLALLTISMAQLMVILDASIVNVAIPSIQRSLHFSPTNLEWLVNAYSLTFGGLLLLGGRIGDLFGRRRVFISGILLFTLASLVGGFATNEAWIIATRAAQGIGGAIAAPTALALIATTFTEGRARDRAMGVYGAMSGVGGAIGVLLGGVLTEELSWRWVFFVNVFFGVYIILSAPRVLPETDKRAGRLDLPGALSATIGMTALVYGLLHAASNSWSSWPTVVSLVVAAALLSSFVLIELRTKEPLLPLRLLANRARAGAYAIALMLGTALFSMFYFLSLFMQEVLHYSALRAGLAYLPFALTLLVFAGVVSQIVGRTGPRRPLMIGTPLAAGGLVWFSLLSPSSTYLHDLLGPMLLVSSGMGMTFVPLALTAVSRVDPHETGIASAVLNTGQQVGGSLGLAVLGTVAATVTRDQLGPLAKASSALAAGVAGRLPLPVREQLATATVHGYSYAFRIGAAVMLAGMAIAAMMGRVRLGGASSAPIA